jgi:hypothetical protein
MAEAENVSDQDGPAPPEPDPGDLIDALFKRVGEGGVRKLVTECLRSVPRARAVEVINSNLGTVRLAPSADRGRMGRLLNEGLHRRRGPVLDVLQTLSRDPFDGKADADAHDRLDAAVNDLNAARGESSGEGDEKKREAAGRVAAALREALEPEEARRLILFNAFPDTVDFMLEGGEEAASS